MLSGWLRREGPLTPYIAQLTSAEVPVIVLAVDACTSRGSVREDERETVLSGGLDDAGLPRAVLKVEQALNSVRPQLRGSLETHAVSSVQVSPASQ